jgi:acetyl-CoA carboxylase carboxyltransferase component
MNGPGFEPDICIALPTAKIAVMGPDAAVNAVYAGKLAAISDADERAAFAAERRAEYEGDVDLLRLVSELIIDDIVDAADLRRQVSARFSVLVGKSRETPAKHHGVRPV